MLIEYQLNLPQYASGAWTIAGASTTSLVGAAVDSGAWSIAGDSSIGLVGAALAAGSWSIAGTSSTSLIGADSATGAWTITGDASAALAGAALAAGELAAAGDSASALAFAAIAAGEFTSAGDSSGFASLDPILPVLLGGGFVRTVARPPVKKHPVLPTVATALLQGSAASACAFGAALSAAARADIGGDSAFHFSSTADVASVVGAITNATISWGGVSIFEGSLDMAAKATSNWTGEPLYDDAEIERRVEEYLRALTVGVQIRVRRPPARRHLRGT